MKYNILFLLLFSLIFQACEDCTITELEGPDTFDCPELMINIGDPCDDGSSDTENDTVDANCICSGELVTNCDGLILAMRLAIANNSTVSIILDRSVKSPLNLLSFTQAELFNDGTIQSDMFFPFQFSTLNPEENTYFYGIQYESGSLNPLVKSSTDGSFAPSYLPSELPYAAPVYHQGALYAINLTYDAPIVQYDILEINETNGQPTVILTDNVTVNSPTVNPMVSSVSNQNDKVSFVVGSSLFEYNPSLNVVTHVLLVPEPDLDMPVIYTGVEYRATTDQMLAMRHQFSNMEIMSSLVSISQDGNFMQTELMDIEGFNFFSDGGILHSTAYAECDDKYYVTTPVDLEQDEFESHIIEVDLPDLTIQSEVFPDFLFGIEVQEF